MNAYVCTCIYAGVILAGSSHSAPGFPTPPFRTGTCVSGPAFPTTSYPTSTSFSGKYVCTYIHIYMYVLQTDL